MAFAAWGGPRNITPVPTNVRPMGGDSQQQAYANPSPVTATTPVNPMEKEAYDRSASYESGLADLTNQEIQRELGRARDEVSVGMAKEGEAAMGRGADPSLFRSRQGARTS
jgi:hypothetical protein